MTEPKVQSTVNFRAVVKADSAAFLGMADLSIRHMKRVGANYFRYKGENETIPFQDWQEDFVRNPVAGISVGQMGRLAGAGILLDAALRGIPVKIIAVEGKEYITVIDPTLQEHSWIPSKAFIGNPILEKAGYETTPAHLFQFKIELLQEPLAAKLPGAQVLDLDVSQSHVLFQYKDQFSVYGYNKSRREFNVTEYTGLYPSVDHLVKITGLKF